MHKKYKPAQLSITMSKKTYSSIQERLFGTLKEAGMKEKFITPPITYPRNTDTQEFLDRIHRFKKESRKTKLRIGSQYQKHIE